MKMKTSYIVIIVLVASTTSIVIGFIQPWPGGHYFSHLGLQFSDNFARYAMRTNFSSEKYLFIVTGYDANPTYIHIDNIQSNQTFQKCSLVYNTKNSNFTFHNRDYENMTKADYPFASNLPIVLNETTELKFECKNPHYAISWPHLALNNTDYLPGETIMLKGQFHSLSQISVFFNSDSSSFDFWNNPNANLIEEKNIITNQNGSFFYSFKIPDNATIGSKWLVAVKENNNEYTLGFKVR